MNANINRGGQISIPLIFLMTQFNRQLKELFKTCEVRLFIIEKELRNSFTHYNVKIGMQINGLKRKIGWLQ